MLHCVVEISEAVLYVVMCLHVVQCCYMLPRGITCCAVLLDVTDSYYMLCSVVRCYKEILHTVQCCYMFHCVVEFCAAVLNFDVFLHAVQCCYILHCVVEFFAAVLYVILCSCMM